MGLERLITASRPNSIVALGRILGDPSLVQAGAWMGGFFQERPDASVQPPIEPAGFVSRISDVPVPDWPYGSNGSTTESALRLFVEAGVLCEVGAGLTPTDTGRGALAAIQLIHQREHERLWERFPWLGSATTGQRVLDAGCGTGAYSLKFRDMGARAVIAADYSAARVRTTQQLSDATGGGVFPIRASVESLPLAGGSIDLVFSRVVIPYVHQGRTMSEIARVLSRGGRALLILHAARFYWGQLRRFGFQPGLIGERARATLGLAGGVTSSLMGWEPKWKLRRVGFHLSYQSQRSFSRLVQRCGLRIDSWEPNGDKPIACLFKP